MKKKASTHGRTESPDFMDLFSLFSPVDFRFCGKDSETAKKLEPYLSEKAFVKYLAKIESLLSQTFADWGLCPQEIAVEIEKAAKQITAKEVYLEEDKVKHPIKALVNSIQNKISHKAKPYVHFTATSNDIICTADAARYRDFTNDVLLPELLELERILIRLARRERSTRQIGRTHGQFAEPVTFGFAIAQYVSRLGGRIVKIKDTANNLRGKIAGSVGAYNALSVLVGDPIEFEKEVLSKINLKPSPISTQIVEAEFITDFVHAVLSAFGIFANIADDMRNLQRSEIGEVREFFGREQVGSSTMPQKRNPIQFEFIKSMWKTFMPRIITVYSDQISEHQRDLTNLESYRFIAEILAVFFTCTRLLKNLMSTLTIDTKHLTKNFTMSKDFLIAEPAHILLSAQGHPNAHECVARIVSESLETGKPFKELFFQNKELKQYVKRIDARQLRFIENPATYTGMAERKTEDVCSFWEKELNLQQIPYE